MILGWIDTHELLHTIGDAKDGLKEKVKENAQTVKDALADTEKITKIK